MVSYASLERIWEDLSGDAATGVSLLQSTRKRLLTFTALLTFAVALAWVAITGPALLGERPLFAFLCGLVPFVFLPFPYLVLRTKLDFDFAAHAYLATLFVIVTLTAGALGGAISTTSFFLMLVPLLATLLLGIRAGAIWFVIVAANFAALHLLRAYLPAPAFELAGVAPNVWVRVEEVSFWNALMMALLALAASFSVANFRAVVGKSSALLMEAGRKTEDAVNARALAERTNQTRAEFLANVSHELRTPLNAIIGYSELLIETADERGDESGAVDNRRVLEAAAKLRTMVNDILKLSSLDAGRTSIDSEDVDIPGLARDAVMALTPAAAAKGDRINLVLDDSLSLCVTDGAKIDFCLRALLTHAITFTESGVINVRATAREIDGQDCFCLEVEDSGQPLDQQAIETLFEPFAQSEDAKGGRCDGANLGLALSRRMIRLLGGDLIAKPAASGGVCFRLSAPMDQNGWKRRGDAAAA